MYVYKINVIGLHGTPQPTTTSLGRLRSVVVGRRTSDRNITSSTPGRCIAG